MIAATLDGMFREPHEWWDAYEEREEAAYREAARGKSCLDCARCVRSERYPEGYCTRDGEMRYEDDRPLEAGFDCFEAAA